MSNEIKTPSPQLQQQAQGRVRQLDLPDVRETFADSIMGMFFDGQSLRLNLGVTRFEQVPGSTEANAQRVPASRLVLTPGAAIDLANQLQQLIAKLTQSGVVKTSPNANASRRASQPEAASPDLRTSADPVRRKLDELADTIEGYMDDDRWGRERK